MLSKSEWLRLTKKLLGRRVRLLRCADPFAPLGIGAEGVVTFVDARGTVHVRWDEGHDLGLEAGAGDRWEVLP
jgi:hypothetical protein